ncbi:MOSC domain-containing protein [Phycisphaera mikurensis]|uniref:MOSC domain-containing protein n=1 Tax=Phycisphaera mikurensis (strain NBRC 102666 / KCTC 22515 / FYK2301M01) TaxID=1142394 RepID=I0II40_PHYMF|nr:MOSC domain-containing protein [Phycisphaera mikurensis]MBB6442509.1 MOSC domain-containing protein YiiM [Phycisphaera mikurensis]BAM04928.1 hypothetical protein PSMK_27690 [Phycisphaera mikurensis NBRC 102666]
MTALQPDDEPRILQQSVGVPSVHDPAGKPWTSGFTKRRVSGPVSLRTDGLDGDGQADLEVHGGPDRAALLYAADHYRAWAEDDGIRFPPAAFGENWTVGGLDERTVCLGDVFAVGSALVEVSQPREPCWKLCRRWNRPELARRAAETGRLGWYVRVLSPGVVASGDALGLRERPLPAWTIARLTALLHDRAARAEAAPFLTACPQLSRLWRETKFSA